MKTKDVEVEGNKVTIWKMNLGFRSDYQGDTTKTVWKKRKNPKTGKEESYRDVEVDNGRLILYTYVYGILKSDDLGIPEPKDLQLGLTPEEKEHRIRVIRNLDIELSPIYEEINAFNGEADEETLKK